MLAMLLAAFQCAALAAHVSTRVGLPVATRAVSVDGIHNMRDLGGLPCAGDRRVRQGAVFRSASPANATASDVALLCSTMGLRTVLDLRGSTESAKDVGPKRLCDALQPCSTDESPVVNINLLDDGVMREGLMQLAKARPKTLLSLLALKAARTLSPSRRLRERLKKASDVRLAKMLNREVRLDLVYWWILTKRGREVAAALRCAGSTDAHPLLLHCTHGKDRTGVVSALLLHICGVPRHAIVEDYAISHAHGVSEAGRWHMSLS